MQYLFISLGHDIVDDTARGGDDLLRRDVDEYAVVRFDVVAAHTSQHTALHETLAVARRHDRHAYDIHTIHERE